MEVLTDVDEGRIRSLQGKGEFFWLDLHGPTSEAFATVGEMLGLHPMAMEDTREFGQRPKVDVYESHVLVVFYTARRTGSNEPVATPLPPGSKRDPVHRWLKSPHDQTYLTIRAPTGLKLWLPSNSAHFRT